MLISEDAAAVIFKCRTAIKALFLFFNLCRSVKLDSQSCSFIFISFLYNNQFELTIISLSYIDVMLFNTKFCCLRINKKNYWKKKEVSQSSQSTESFFLTDIKMFLIVIIWFLLQEIKLNILYVICRFIIDNWKKPLNYINIIWCCCNNRRR